VTHDPEVAQTCDRIVHMRDGRILEIETREDATLALAGGTR
jgi:ABC-type lipoprotein export system ATPase subunit